MSRSVALASAAFLTLVAPAPASGAHWPAPQPPIIPGIDGYVPIPGAAVIADKTTIYRAVWDVTKRAKAPAELAPGVLQAADTVGTLTATGAPGAHIRFVLVFHGGGLDAILTDAAYRAKYGVANPNLAVLKALKARGAELYVCGQNLAGDDVDPATLTPLVTVAADALVVLVTYQDRGYALMSF